jgi:uncharacterized protein
MREHSREAQWISLDGATHEHLRLGWENGGWTADGVITGLEIQYALRIDEHWRVRQFLLFRDVEEPDLWLGSDGAGRWGEINGGHRADLDGCRDLDLVGSPFTTTLPIRRLGLHVGHGAEVVVAWVDPETLAVTPSRQRYSRLSDRLWRVESIDDARAFSAELEVDEDGLVLDYPGQFQRVV